MTYTFRDVVESGHVLVIATGPGSDSVGVVTWDHGRDFTVWLALDGRDWQRMYRFQYDADDWRDAQEWAAHRLAQWWVAYPV